MKNYKDLDYKKLAIIYLVEDTIKSKKDSLYIGMAVIITVFGILDAILAIGIIIYLLTNSI